MLTGAMYEKLSEWTSNVSVLFLGSIIVPFITNAEKVDVNSLFWGMILMLFSLWLSLRLTRLSERRKFQ